eukprot:TRINITY_DN12653_c0_g1_i2.p1 TRINITY_DN12653_c0_g1~~TRINITY_DN12653_c0_g1_i2.p1  ORF type:complete len:167 (-),score=10.67 TRINITY_DN12653_c0_g1_i2:233-733(-)
MWTGKWQICHTAVQTVLNGGNPERIRSNSDETKLEEEQDLREIYDLGITVELRRVRQRIGENLDSNEPAHNADGNTGVLPPDASLKLDLSLHCDSRSKSSNLQQQRISSPSTASVNSDGSVNKNATNRQFLTKDGKTALDARSHEQNQKFYPEKSSEHNEKLLDIS